MLPLLYQALGIQPGLWNAAILLLVPHGPGVFAQELKVGDGISAGSGKRITIEFVATTLKGRELANTEKRGLPYIFPFQKNPDMWTRLVEGMNVNGSRLVLLLPEVAYGAKGVPGLIPPGEPLLVWVRMTSAIPEASAAADPAAPESGQ